MFLFLSLEDIILLQAILSCHLKSGCINQGKNEIKQNKLFYWSILFLKKNSMVIRWHLTYELYVFRQMFSDKYSLFLNLNSRVAIASFVAFHLCSALCMRKHFFSEYSIFMWNNVYIGVVYFSKLCENKWTICVEE